MSEEGAIPEGETGFDRALAFTLPHRDARGRIVRLGPVLDEILSAHDYPTAIRHLLAEALVLTALIGSLMKDKDSQLTIQAQTQGGIVDLLVCDYLSGALRGYVRHDPERLAELGSFPSLSDLFGEGGYLAVTFDMAATDQRYQGIVPLAGETLADACQSYFTQSEQVPTLIRVGVRWTKGRCIAAGLLAQHLPEGEEGRERLHARMDHPEWEHVATLAGSVRQDELVDPGLSLEQILWRLYHEESEIRVDAGGVLTKGCRCNADYYRGVLGRFPREEQLAMHNDEGVIVIDCAFCSKEFRITL